MKTRPTSLVAALTVIGAAWLIGPAAPICRADAPASTGTAQALPFHTIEGTGGGAITPTAYLSNATPNQEGIGKPSFAISYVNLGQKSVTALTASETLFGRLELGVGVDELDLGTLPSAILKATTVDIHKSRATLTSWNVRYQAIKEKTNVPAVTIGVQYKQNTDIGRINKTLGGALNGIGLKDTHGFDYTLTATKLFPNVGSHALVATLGLRESKAANLGFLGFTKDYKTTVEGSLIYLPAPKIGVVYEYRQKSSSLGQIPGVIGKESDWHAFDVAYIVSNHATIVAGYGQFGKVADTTANSAYWLQLKENL